MSAELVAQFTPENFGEWCRERFDRFTSDLHPAADPGGYARADIVGYVQSLPEAEINRPLLVMAVNAGKEINERSSRRRQFDFARKQLQAAMDCPPAKVKGLFTQGLFAFYDDAGNFRLSLITGRAEGHRLVYGDFKRQSFFVAPDRENKTFRARMASSFATWERLVEAFSVETLTKEFYNSLFAWYERAMDPASKVSFPNDLARDDDDRHMLPEHLIRLITRLMFVWFIRQKNLVPKELFDTAELRKLLARFDPLSPKQDNYYRAILQNLFFATLNCEIGERGFAREGSFQENQEHFGIKLLYRYRDEFACPTNKVIELFRTVPFLNGGLFECLDKRTDYQDGFSRNPKRRARIPNSLFFDDEGLITLFARYDFTVDENSPNDADVALDPELLGKVFENLLGAYNPETRQTARKQSGSFYTPREIVNYMVDESLVAHLRTKVPEAEEPAIRALLSEEDPPTLPDPLRRKLVEALYRGRILDPACGSGAFPMGVLLKMVHLLQRLDEKNALWHEVVMAETERDLAEAEALSAAEKAERRRRITESFDQSVNAPDYARKLYLIENCVFGVDIQSIAVQIAKLRAFITLVCDQRPTADPAKNYGMLPLPNLETKFVAANTLIGLEADFADGLKTADGVSLLNDPELHRQRADLAEVRHRHFRARNAPEKNKCRAQDEKLRGKIRARLVEIASKPNAEKIALWQAGIDKLRQQRRAVEKEDWRDVVRATPMQGSLFEAAPKPMQTTMRLDVNKEKRDKIDDDIHRLTRDIETEQNRARNKSAFQHEADRLAAWDPYDQNASSPFFDPEWMFDVKDGFDIVIGNPPYISVERFARTKQQADWKRLYSTFASRGDVYCFFYERGVDLLRDLGVLSIISSNKFQKAGYGRGLREFLRSHRIRLLMDFCELPVFEAATDPMIVVASKGAPPDGHTFPVVVIKSEAEFEKLAQSLATRGTLYKPEQLGPDGWSLQGGGGLGIVEKMRAAGTPLSMCEGIAIMAGIKTGFNTAFWLDSETARQFVRQNPNAAKRFIKPLLLGDDARRWCARPITKFLIYTPRSTSEKDLGSLRQHMAQWRPRLEQRALDQKWYELQQAQYRYAQTYEKPKIVYPDIALEPRFSIDTLGRYPDMTAFSIPCADLWLLALLNSKAAWFYLSSTAAVLGDADNRGRVRCKTQYVSNIPVPDVESVDKVRLSRLVERATECARAGDAEGLRATEGAIDEIVYRLYGLTPAEIAIIEGREAGGKKAASAVKPVKAAAGAKKPRKSVLTEDPDLA